MRELFLSLLIFSLFAGPIQAQRIEVHRSDLRDYHRGLDYFEKEKFGAAQRHFEKLIELHDGQNTEVLINARYYAALCGMELFNRDADYLLREFIRLHPESPKVKEAYFQLGIYNYRKRNWRKVIDWFEKVDKFDLSKEQQDEFFFKHGYALFNLKKYDEASKKFYQVKDSEGTYAPLATYYFAHIEYQRGNLQTAYEDLLKVKDHPKFVKIAPYYISQILYKQGRYDELLAFAKPLLDSTKIKRRSEIARLIGDAFYGTKDYEQALTYLSKASEPPSRLDALGEFQMADSYYKTAKYYDAIRIFSKLSSRRDSIGQLSLYEMADAYLRVGEKTYANNAFLSASEMDFYPELAEDALFNYAKLTYDVAFDPYNSAVRAFRKYIRTYPESERVEEAYAYITKVYLSSKNYDEALRSIENMKPLNDQLKKAYQLICYNKATELFQNNLYASAVNYYDRSMTYPVDRSMKAKAYFWKAESFYRNSQYSDAVESYKDFFFQPEAILQSEFNEANYNLGYSYFKQKDYENAQKWFRKFVFYKDEDDSARLADSYLRTGDCFFVNKSYEDAAIYYQKAVEINTLDQDYALFQLAIANGLTRKQDEKISTLEKLVAQYPQSNLKDATYYELGRSYLLRSDDKKALSYFEKVIDEMTNSIYMKSCLLNKALIHYNAGQNDVALGVFKRIVSDYPTYEDSKEALLGIKNIYIENGNIDEYTAYIDKLDFVDFSEAELDSAVYESAELKYLSGDCAGARNDLKKYLDRFDPANFEINARFYLAECFMKVNEKEKALEQYTLVISKPKNRFSEESLLKASELNYQKEDYEAALSNYISLEKLATSNQNSRISQIGLMRCSYFLEDHANSINYASKVLQFQKLDEQLYSNAHYIKAISSYRLGDLDAAFNSFKIVSDTTRSSESAESKYYMGEIYFKNDSLKSSEKMVFELVNQVPNYAYWTAKGLILLADIYLASGDLFQAKATLQSIVDNYDGDKELIELAKDNIKKIEEMESGSDQEETEELEIEMNPGRMGEFDELFNEDPEDEEF